MTIAKIILLLMSAILLVFGSITGNAPLEISGAFVFLLFPLLDLLMEYKEAKLFRAGKWKPTETRHILETVEHRFGQGMVIVGLVLAVLQHISGMIIWGGAIVSFLISGWISRDVAGIPLEMGYGGWRKRNFRRRY